MVNGFHIGKKNLITGGWLPFGHQPTLQGIMQLCYILSEQILTHPPRYSHLRLSPHWVPEIKILVEYISPSDT